MLCSGILVKFVVSLVVRLQFICSKDLLLERSLARKVSYENGFEVQLLEKGSVTRRFTFE